MPSFDYQIFFKSQDLQFLFFFYTFHKMLLNCVSVTILIY